MDNEFAVKILTPEHSFYEGDAELAILPTTEGEVGILKGHIPMVFALKSGNIKIVENNRLREAATSDGFAEMTKNGLLVLTQTAEWATEIEEGRVRESLERAREELKNAKNAGEREWARAGILRALNRLRLIGRINVKK